MIEGDIKGYFDNIDHHKLAKLLMKKLKDQNLMDLYWKLVKAGYVFEKYTWSDLLVPQGGVLSPLLSNIYLHEFDAFMQDLIIRYSQPKRQSKNYSFEFSKAKPEYFKKTGGTNKNLALVEEPLTEQNKKTVLNHKTPSVIRNDFCERGSRVYYNRYADDWIIGITGDQPLPPHTSPRELAKKIQHEANDFLKNTLKVLSKEKTKITQLTQDKVHYLGFDISRRRSTIYTESQKSYLPPMSSGTWRAQNSLILLIEAPIDKLISKLIEQGYAWEKDRMPKAVTKWIYLNPEDIIRRYNWVTRGILEYYKSVENKNQLGQVIWILKLSAVNTLARKLNISPKQVWKKYGNPITVKFMSENQEKSITLC